MKHSKAYYITLNFSGFRWFCFSKGWHFFSKKVENGWLEMKCMETDIEDGNAAEMAERGLTK
jgi:hypothetical protein